MKKERHEKGPICLVCPMISDRFNMTLIPAAVNILYISFPKPASDAFPNTKPCLQNCSGGSPRTLGAPEIRKHMLITESHIRSCPQALNVAVTYTIKKAGKGVFLSTVHVKAGVNQQSSHTSKFKWKKFLRKKGSPVITQCCSIAH